MSWMTAVLSPWKGFAFADNSNHSCLLASTLLEAGSDYEGAATEKEKCLNKFNSPF